MSEFKVQLLQRTHNLAKEVIELVNQLDKSTGSNVIKYQIVKSASSTAANFRASQKARSQREFYSKLSITVEEADETKYWLQLIEDCNLIEGDLTSLQALRQEADSLSKVIWSSRETVRKNMKKKA